MASLGHNSLWPSHTVWPLENDYRTPMQFIFSVEIKLFFDLYFALLPVNYHIHIRGICMALTWWLLPSRHRQEKHLQNNPGFSAISALQAQRLMMLQLQTHLCIFVNVNTMFAIFKFVQKSMFLFPCGCMYISWACYEYVYNNLQMHKIIVIICILYKPIGHFACLNA